MSKSRAFVRQQINVLFLRPYDKKTGFFDIYPEKDNIFNLKMRLPVSKEERKNSAYANHAILNRPTDCLKIELMLQNSEHDCPADQRRRGENFLFHIICGAFFLFLVMEKW